MSHQNINIAVVTLGPHQCAASGAGATLTGSVFGTSGYDRIVVVAASDQTVTINVYQGDLNASSGGKLVYKDTLSVAGGALADGSGVKASFEVVGPDCRVDVVNGSGVATTTLCGTVSLRKI